MNDKIIIFGAGLIAGIVIANSSVTIGSPGIYGPGVDKFYVRNGCYNGSCNYNFNRLRCHNMTA